MGFFRHEGYDGQFKGKKGDLKRPLTGFSGLGRGYVLSCTLLAFNADRAPEGVQSILLFAVWSLLNITLAPGVSDIGPELMGIERVGNWSLVPYSNFDGAKDGSSQIKRSLTNGVSHLPSMVCRQWYPTGQGIMMPYLSKNYSMLFHENPGRSSG